MKRALSTRSETIWGGMSGRDETALTTYRPRQNYGAKISSQAVPTVSPRFLLDMQSSSLPPSLPESSPPARGRRNAAILPSSVVRRPRAFPPAPRGGRE